MDNRGILALQKWVETKIPWEQLEEPSDSLLNPEPDSQIAVGTVLLMSAAYAYLTAMLAEDTDDPSSTNTLPNEDDLDDILHFGFPLVVSFTDMVAWNAKGEESPWLAITKDKRTFNFEAWALRPRHSARIFWGFIREFVATDSDDWDMLMTQVLRSLKDPHMQLVSAHIAIAIYLRIYFWKAPDKCEEKVNRWRDLASRIAEYAEDPAMFSDEISREMEKMVDPEVPLLFELQSCCSKAWPNQPIFFASDYVLVIYDDAIAAGSRKDVLGRSAIQAQKKEWQIALEHLDLVEERRMRKRLAVELRHLKRVDRAIRGGGLFRP